MLLNYNVRVLMCISCSSTAVGIALARSGRGLRSSMSPTDSTPSRVSALCRTVAGVLQLEMCAMTPFQSPAHQLSTYGLRYMLLWQHMYIHVCSMSAFWQDLLRSVLVHVLV